MFVCSKQFSCFLFHSVKTKDLMNTYKTSPYTATYYALILCSSYADFFFFPLFLEVQEPSSIKDECIYLDMEPFSPKCLHSLNVFISIPKVIILERHSWTTPFKMASPVSSSTTPSPQIHTLFTPILTIFSIALTTVQHTFM